MPDFPMLNGTFDQALTMIAERTVASRACGGFVKRADFDWQSMLGDAASKGQSALSSAWADPNIRRGLIGAGVGAGLGGISSLASGRKRTLSDVLTGGLLGGAVGGGGSLAYENFLKAPQTPATPATTPIDPAVAAKADEARQELGVLGAPKGKVDSLLGDVKGGKKPEDAASELNKAMPGMGEQLRNIPSAVGTAIASGRPGQALAQADVPGFKNIGLNLPTAEAGAAAAFGPEAISGAYDKLRSGLWNKNRLVESFDRWRLNRFLANPDKGGRLEAALGGNEGELSALTGNASQSGAQGIRFKAPSKITQPATETPVMPTPPPFESAVSPPITSNPLGANTAAGVAQNRAGPFGATLHDLPEASSLFDRIPPRLRDILDKQFPNRQLPLGLEAQLNRSYPEKPAINFTPTARTTEPIPTGPFGTSLRFKSFEEPAPNFGERFQSQTGRLLNWLKPSPLSPAQAEIRIGEKSFSRDRIRSLANDAAKSSWRHGWKGNLLAGTLPLLMAEWGRGGYRSGQEPFMDLARANQTLYGNQK